MPKFKWKLDKLLNIKKIQLKEEERKLQQLAAMLDELEKNIRDVTEKVRNLEKRITRYLESKKEVVPIDFLRSQKENFIYLAQEMLVRLKKLQDDYKLQEKIYKEILKEIKALEKLREKAFNKFRQEQLKKEQKMFDEIASRRRE